MHHSFCPRKKPECSLPRILDALHEVAGKGIQEVILTGVNTGDFGRGTDMNFLQLLQQLDRQEEIARFRISSIEPNLLTDEIIEFVATSKRFMPPSYPLAIG